jgi:hypothetical protein
MGHTHEKPNHQIAPEHVQSQSASWSSPQYPYRGIAAVMILSKVPQQWFLRPIQHEPKSACSIVEVKKKRNVPTSAQHMQAPSKLGIAA